MSEAVGREAFVEAHVRWNVSDLEGFLALLEDDVVYVVNIDGIGYAASANGKHELRRRLRLLLEMFVVNAFVPETIVHGPDCSRSTVLGYYKHKATGERLDIKVRFVAWMRNGLIWRMEEHHDAAYVAAFQRFVSFIEATVHQQAECEVGKPSGLQ